MRLTYTFRVFGLPKPQGSKKAITHKTTGRAIVMESAGPALKTWREDVKQAALAACTGPQLDGPVLLSVVFYLPRPKGHYRTGKHAHLLRDAAPRWPHSMPDLDKLLRSTGDAITAAAVWSDDARIVQLVASKAYADRLNPPGAAIRIEPLDPMEAAA